MPPHQTEQRVEDQCLPQVDSGGNCNLPVCVGLPRGALSEHWRRTTSLAHCELSKWLSMSRQTAHYIIAFLELQICFCLLSLCMASGSLIFFTFDINLTYLVCNGQEELFRYHPTKIIIVSIKGRLTLMTMSLGENLHCSRW